MRRVVLLGNGFDRAHGYKTLYSDFIKNLIDKSINYDNEIREELFNVSFLRSDWQTYEYIKDNFRDLTGSRHPDQNDQIHFNNELLYTIMYQYFSADWIHIELLYYEQLCSCLNSSKYDKNRLEKLNSDFLLITKYLESYLVSLFKEDTITLIPELLEIFQSKKPESILLINFNYTPIANAYLSFLRIEDKNLIHIHGELESEDNPIIFGYGDITDDKYPEISAQNSNTFLENLKQHKYKNWDSYDNIIEYIDKDNFEIFSIGHSLGLSDKTFLKEVLEHKNVSKVNLFYHKDRKGYQNINNNLSRIVDPKIGNEKVFNFRKSKMIPQAKKTPE